MVPFLRQAVGGADRPDHHVALAGTRCSFDTGHALNGVAVAVVIGQGAGHRAGEQPHVADLTKGLAAVLVLNTQCHDRQWTYRMHRDGAQQWPGHGSHEGNTGGASQREAAWHENGFKEGRRSLACLYIWVFERGLRMVGQTTAKSTGAKPTRELGRAMDLRVGCNVGKLLGARVSVVGVMEGLDVGTELVGELVGDPVGSEVVGEIVGPDVVGAMVGDEVGAMVGDTVGTEVVGDKVGTEVIGDCVGLEVGLWVASTVV